MIFSLADIDECAENSTICGDLQCANIPGSFQCLGKCDVGFKRTMDDKECVGKVHMNTCPNKNFRFIKLLGNGWYSVMFIWMALLT